MDVIRIRGLKAEVFLGVYEEEQRAPRPVVFDIELETDLSRACATDDLADTVDYHALALEIKAAISPGDGEKTSFQLVERLAQVVADICLGFDKRIAAVRVKAVKPAAFPFADAAEVEIRRRKTLNS